MNYYFVQPYVLSLNTYVRMQYAHMYQIIPNNNDNNTAIIVLNTQSAIAYAAISIQPNREKKNEQTDPVWFYIQQCMSIAVYVCSLPGIHI